MMEFADETRPQRSADDVSIEDLMTCRRMYQAGYGIEQLASKFRRRRESIQSWVAGLDRGATRRSPSQEWERKVARQMAADGFGSTTIARLLERSPGSVRYWIADVKRPPKSEKGKQEIGREASRSRRLAGEELRRKNKARALKLYATGELSRTQIAASVGLSIDTVNRFLVEEGIEIRPPFPGRHLNRPK